MTSQAPNSVDANAAAPRTIQVAIILAFILAIYQGLLLGGAAVIDALNGVNATNITAMAYGAVLTVVVLVSTVGVIQLRRWSRPVMLTVMVLIFASAIVRMVINPSPSAIAAIALSFAIAALVFVKASDGWFDRVDAGEKLKNQQLRG